MFSPWGASEIPPITTVSSSVATRVTGTTTGTTRMPSTTLPTSTVADGEKGGLMTMEGLSGESTQRSGRAGRARCFLHSCGVKRSLIAPRSRNLSGRSFLRPPNTVGGQMSMCANPERLVGITLLTTPYRTLFGQSPVISWSWRLSRTPSNPSPEKNLNPSAHGLRPWLLT